MMESIKHRSLHHVSHVVHACCCMMCVCCDGHANPVCNVSMYIYSLYPANLHVAICSTHCDGHEAKLLDCTIAHCGGFNYCSHYEDVAIACSE